MTCIISILPVTHQIKQFKTAHALSIDRKKNYAATAGPGVVKYPMAMQGPAQGEIVGCIFYENLAVVSHCDSV